MCLYIISIDPPIAIVPVYKVVLRFGDKLLSPYFKFEYKAGWNEAIDEIKIRTTVLNSGVINEGILHCFYEKRIAENSMTSDWRIMLTGYGKPEDFVAWGSCCEVGFKRIFISQEEITRALKC